AVRQVENIVNEVVRTIVLAVLSQHAKLFLRLFIQVRVPKVDVDVIGFVQRVDEAHAFGEQRAIEEGASQEIVLIGVAVSESELYRRSDEIVFVDVIIQSKCISSEHKVT